MAEKIFLVQETSSSSAARTSALPSLMMCFAAVISGVICCCMMEHSAQCRQTSRMVCSCLQHAQTPTPSLNATAPEISPIYQRYGAHAGDLLDAVAADTPSGFHAYSGVSPLPPQETSPVVLYFHASWSGNCQRMGSTLKNSQDVQKWKSRLRILHVDIQKYPELSRKYAVTDFPTLLYLSADGASVRQLVGNRPAAQILTFLEDVGRQETAAVREP